MHAILHHARAWRGYVPTAKRIGGFFMAQSGVQVLGILMGFMIVRLLSKSEYAAYTIINTLGPVIIMLSDCGIGTGLSAIGRKVWEDDRQMGSLVTTGLLMRRRFALAAFVVMGPFLAWMLYRNQTPWGTIVLITTLNLVGLSFQITASIARKVLELRQNIGRLGKLDIASALLRLALLAAFALLLPRVTASLAIAAGTASGIFSAIFCIRAARAQIAWNEPPSAEYQRTIYGLVWQAMPLTIYFIIQGQVGVWLMGAFGNKQAVADLGAATRLAVIFNTFAMAFNTIMLTRFARENRRHQQVVKFWQIVLGLTGALGAWVALVWLVPQPFLWLLGPKYDSLTHLLWLVVLSSGLVTLAGACYGMNLSKGWIPPAAVVIPVEAATQLALLFCFDLHTLAGVLTFICFACVPPAAINIFFLFRRIRQEPE
jgi:O-antigen/teichoic acid export membrane protein